MTRVHKGQPYTLVSEHPHTCRDGRDTMLQLWRSLCAECGAAFTFETPAKAKKFEPNRRCQKHKRPGQRVGGAA